MTVELILKMVYCFVASFFFGLVMNSPKKALILSSIIASIGYLTYIIFVKLDNPKAGFFWGTLIIAFLGELCARWFKMPATIFIFPAVIPIVPGLGLYQTILALVQDDIPSALEIGVSTFLNIGSMAVAMAIVSLVVLKIRFKSKKQ